MDEKRLTLGALEAAVLNVLWDRGESTVAEVVDAMPRGRERHYNTCSTVLTRLVKRGLVERSAEGRVHRFRATVGRDELGRAVLATVRRDVFGGSLGDLVAALFDGRRCRAEDVARLQALAEEISADDDAPRTKGRRRGR